MSTNRPPINWLPLQRPWGDYKINDNFVTYIDLSTNLQKFDEGRYSMFWDIWHDMPIFAQFYKNFNSCPSNSQVIGPMFTKFLHYIEALLPLLIRTLIRRDCIPFMNARAKSEGDQFRHLQMASQN